MDLVALMRRWSCLDHFLAFVGNPESRVTISTVDFRRCSGTLPRRSLVQLGLSGLGSLALPDLLRLESQAASRTGQSLGGKSIIVLWLWGGASHMETFDLKPCLLYTSDAADE